MINKDTMKGFIAGVYYAMNNPELVSFDPNVYVMDKIQLTAGEERNAKILLGKCARMMDMAIDVKDNMADRDRIIKLAWVSLDAVKKGLDIEKAKKDLGFDELWYMYGEGESK